MKRFSILMIAFLCNSCHGVPDTEGFVMKIFSRKSNIEKRFLLNEFSKIDLDKQCYTFKHPEKVKPLNLWVGDSIRIYFHDTLFVDASIFDVYSSQAFPTEGFTCYTMNGRLLTDTSSNEICFWPLEKSRVDNDLKERIRKVLKKNNID